MRYLDGPGQLRVNCDGCNVSELARYYEEGEVFELGEELEEAGWNAQRDLCPDCAGRDLPPAIEPKPGQPWAPVTGRIGGTGFGLEDTTDADLAFERGYEGDR